jgi:hypothetical protein
VLPSQTPNIEFDAAGVCNYCHTYQPVSYKGEAAFVEQLDRFRGTNGPYDCLVPISGGRDSSYVLLKLVKDYGMRVLAVNYENPFTVPQARANIKNAVETLDVPLIQFRNGDENHRITFRQTVSAWLKRPSPALIPIVCIGCKPAWRHIYRVARQHRINCIVSGGNPYEVISFKRELAGISRDEAPDKAFYKYVYILRILIKNRAYFKPRVLMTLARSYLTGNPNSLGIKLIGGQISWLELFNYVPWDEATIIQRITNELGWDYPRELESNWRFDCRVKHLVDLMYLSSLQMTDKDDFYAKLVREGRVARETAVQRLASENKLYPTEIDILLRQAGFEDTSLVDELFAKTVVLQHEPEEVTV